MSSLVDSHCHLQSLEPAEREDALRLARDAGVRGFLVPAIRLDDADELLEMCARHDDVWCALGTHPHHAKEWRRGDAERLHDLLGEPGVVAVGECGLDFYYDNSPREKQERAMREQWDVALDAGFPVVVHNRDSNEKMTEIASLPEYAQLRADFHSFAGGAPMAERLLERAHVLGLSGMITFPKADNVREVIPQTDRDRILVETDTPYLAPVPHRGRPNRPAYVVHVAERLALEWDVDLQEVAGITTANFFRFFDRARPPASGDA